MTGFSLVGADGVRIPLSGSVTAGRHVDNDILLAGEDVRDFHFRLRVSEREVTITVLPNAVVEVNGVAIDSQTSLIVDDRLTLGQETFRLLHTAADDERMESWALRGFDNQLSQVVTGEVVVGRDPAADFVLVDSHVSRRHARLFEADGILWIEDLKSANGTTINGQRITRGARLFHGDEIGFDQVAFQVAAQGADLTPLQSTVSMFTGNTDRAPFLADEDDDGVDTEEISAIDFPAVPDVARSSEPGCFLTGLLDQEGRRETLQVGSYLVGRSTECDIEIDHRSVSERHAELSVSAEDCYISDLMSTNGLWINGSAVQAAPLKDGDRVSFGSQQFIYQRSVAPPDATQSRWREYGIALGLLILILLVVFMV